MGVPRTFWVRSVPQIEGAKQTDEQAKREGLNSKLTPRSIGSKQTTARVSSQAGISNHDLRKLNRRTATSCRRKEASENRPARCSRFRSPDGKGDETARSAAETHKGGIPNGKAASADAKYIGTSLPIAVRPISQKRCHRTATANKNEKAAATL
jgi:hypothetical protein